MILQRECRIQDRLFVFSYSQTIVNTRLVSTGLPDSWYQCLPPIDEKDIEEKAIKGSGPGGQAINKTQNCCQIKHIPTGEKNPKASIVYLKNLLFRSGCDLSTNSIFGKNRFLARRQFQGKLDVYHNGDDSLVAQYKREKSEKKEAKRLETKKTLEKKRAFESEQDIY
jgi:hypothetical protein